MHCFVILLSFDTLGASPIVHLSGPRGPRAAIHAADSTFTPNLLLASSMLGRDGFTG